MKTIFILSILLIASTLGAAKTSFKPYYKIANHIYKNNSNLNSNYIDSIAKSIYNNSIKYDIDAFKVSALLRQECNYKLNCINPTSKDYSIGQINIKTIKAFKFNKSRLLKDLNYSIEATFIVLADFKKMYGHKESNWICRYNVGSRRNTLIKIKCDNYIKLLTRYI